MGARMPIDFRIDQARARADIIQTAARVNTFAGPIDTAAVILQRQEEITVRHPDAKPDAAGAGMPAHVADGFLRDSINLYLHGCVERKLFVEILAARELISEFLLRRHGPPSLPAPIAAPQPARRSPTPTG